MIQRVGYYNVNRNIEMIDTVCLISKCLRNNRLTNP